MGVILRQGFKHSIVTVVATVIGTVNSLFIYTTFLTKEELGFFQYFLSTATLVTPFILLGLDAVTAKYFPIFREKAEKNNGFFFFVLVIPIISFLVFLLCFTLFRSTIEQFFNSHPNRDLLIEYLYLLPCLIFTMIFSSVLTRYITNYKLIVVPEIINNVWLKIAVPSLVLLYFFGHITYAGFLLYLTVAYGLRIVFFIAYLLHLGKLDLRPNFTFFDKPILKEIRSFAGYSMLGGIGTLMATRIDIQMVGSLIDMPSVAVYGIALFIATVIGIPYMSVSGISSPIIAELMNKNNLVEIKKLYQKTSLNLLIIGVLLLVGIWSSIDLLYEIMPKGDAFKEGKYIVLILGLAKIIDMATGLNSHIIIYSKYYQFNFYVILILAILNISLNLLFIPLGIKGVALATFSSMLIYNLIKYIFVLNKFDMQPLTSNMIWVILIGLLAYVMTLILPTTNNPFLDIIINSVMITLVYGVSILYFNLSEDITDLKSKLLAFVKTKF